MFIFLRLQVVRFLQAPTLDDNDDDQCVSYLFFWPPTADIDNDHFSDQLPETIAMEVIISNRFYLIEVLKLMLRMTMPMMMVDKYGDG